MSEILAHLREKSELGVQLEYAQIWEEWPVIVGEHLSRHTHPVRVKNNVLVIYADSPAWMHKLAYKKWHILKHINRLVNKEPISDLFVQLEPEENPDSPQYDV